MILGRAVKQSVLHIMLMICLFVSLFFSFILFVPDVQAQADDNVFGTEEIDDQILLGGDDIRVIVSRIINVVLGLIGIVLLGMILYAGYNWMTAGGQEDKVATAKETMVRAVIGLVIVLSAFAITQFILRALGDATGVRRDPNGGPAQGSINSFAGSGSLGTIIQDHYPARDQVDVPRNTFVVVTFREYIDPSSAIINTNGSCWGENDEPTVDPAVCDNQDNPRPEYFGDCVDVDGVTVCDQVATSSVQIFESVEDAEENQDEVAVREADAYAIYENDGTVKTLKFVPRQPLGSDERNVGYTVRLTNEITRQNGDGVFAGTLDQEYSWQFETNTELDIVPPQVVVTHPQDGETIPRNSIVQIRFNEPIDPTSIFVNPEALLLDPVEEALSVDGQWQSSNEFTTYEYVTGLVCGQNSCGEPMYCLPVACEEGDLECASDYAALARTAQRDTREGKPAFAGIPLSGITDMAGNRLDGDGNGEPADNRPIGEDLIVEGAEKEPDNVWWDFTVSNKIDNTPPHIIEVSPQLDQQGVRGNVPVEVRFSRPMWIRTFYEASLLEHPEALQLADGTTLRPVWYRARATEGEGVGTTLLLDHREFGPNNENLYYFVNVPGTVHSLNQQCFYPGSGPWYSGNVAEECHVVRGAGGRIISQENCVAVEPNVPDEDTACVRRLGVDSADDESLRVTNTEECIQFLQRDDISPRIDDQ